MTSDEESSSYIGTRRSVAYYGSPLRPRDELKVTFYPALYLQRRLWILNILRAESVSEVLDVGCGEGQLLSVLCQPAPWLKPPAASILPPSPVDPSTTDPHEATYLHITRLHGLDISSEDLEFAIRDTEPISSDQAPYNATFFTSYTNESIRWDELRVGIWKGGLETINNEFVNIECIVGTEVIEHLTPDVFPLFAPVLLGTYHPRLLLITTPSYTYNSRFAAPDAPSSARQGFPDPTQRTNRKFRHSDHKFEWTVEEFEAWCNEVAEAWGYDVTASSLGRAVEADEWGRDEELGGATQVAIFRRLDTLSSTEREKKAREIVSKAGTENEPHKLLAHHHHPAHSSSTKPKSLKEIGDAVEAKMKEFKVPFIRLEEMWFEHDIAVMCGGWIEYLGRAAEESDNLSLNKGDGIRKERTAWTIELKEFTGMMYPSEEWPTEGTSVDWMPPDDWMPDEEGTPDDSIEEIEPAPTVGDIPKGAVSQSWSPSPRILSDPEDSNDETDGPTFSGWGSFSLEEDNQSPWQVDDVKDNWGKGDTGWGKSSWKRTESPEPGGERL